MDSDDTSELERKILEVLDKGRSKHMLVDQVRKRSGENDAGTFMAALNSLATGGLVAFTRKDRVASTSRLGYVTGTLKAGRRGKAVVIPHGGGAPIRISAREVRPAMHGDRVMVEVQPARRHGLDTGTIKSVLNRRTTTVVGTIIAEKGRSATLAPVDSRIGYVFRVDDSEIDPMPDANTVVEATIVEYPTLKQNPPVHLRRVLGTLGTLQTEIQAISRSMGIPSEFPDDALAELDAKKAPGSRVPKDRVDLTKSLTITIDPEDAKDFDDAVSIEQVQSGYRLTVSIADVSHYVPENSALDREASERGCSVYFPGTVVPMLPDKISGDLASLKPKAQRFAVTVVLDIDRSGQVHTAEFFRSVIRSDRRLTYEQFQDLLDEASSKRGSRCAKTPEPSLDQRIGDMATVMLDCCEALRSARASRGAIDFDLPEGEIQLDNHGEPTAIQAKPRLDAHRVVEEFMLAANEAVAKFLIENKIPGLYRVHDTPDVFDVERLAERLGRLGLRLEIGQGELDGKKLAPVLAKAHERGIEGAVAVMILRAMKQAEYSANRGIHFGLATSTYTHFTSPIRRYPDLVVHRALLGALADQAEIGEADLTRIARASSRSERRAMEAERESRAAAAAILMQSMIGERFTGTVVRVERYGFHVQLHQHFVEGFVPAARLPGYYRYFREEMVLQSTNSKHSIEIGQPVEVKLFATDLAERSIELRLCREN